MWSRQYSNSSSSQTTTIDERRQKEEETHRKEQEREREERQERQKEQERQAREKEEKEQEERCKREQELQHLEWMRIQEAEEERKHQRKLADEEEEKKKEEERIKEENDMKERRQKQLKDDQDREEENEKRREKEKHKREEEKHRRREEDNKRWRSTTTKEPKIAEEDIEEMDIFPNQYIEQLRDEFEERNAKIKEHEVQEKMKNKVKPSILKTLKVCFSSMTISTIKSSNDGLHPLQSPRDVVVKPRFGGNSNADTTPPIPKNQPELDKIRNQLSKLREKNRQHFEAHTAAIQKINVTVYQGHEELNNTIDAILSQLSGDNPERTDVESNISDRVNYQEKIPSRKYGHYTPVPFQPSLQVLPSDEQISDDGVIKDYLQQIKDCITNNSFQEAHQIATEAESFLRKYAKLFCKFIC